MSVTETKMVYVPPQSGQSFWNLGEFISIKVRGNDTSGAYALTEVVTLPQAGLPPHYHEDHDEAYYILEGEYTFQNISQNHTFTATPGAFFIIPRGMVHAYQNAGTTNARMLLLHTPAGLEGFFEELGLPAVNMNEPLQSERPSEERILAVARKYNTYPGPQS